METACSGPVATTMSISTSKIDHYCSSYVEVSCKSDANIEVQVAFVCVCVKLQLSPSHFYVLFSDSHKLTNTDT